MKHQIHFIGRLVLSAAFVLLSTRHGLPQSCITLQCPSDLIVECAGPDGATAAFEVTGTNHCGGGLVIECQPASGSLFPPGATLVACSATDSETNQCSFTLTVHDTTAPVLTCPRLLVTPCESPAGAAVFFAVTAADACDTNVTVVCSVASGATFPPGTNTVRCTAQDGSGNESACSFDVIITGSCLPHPCLTMVCPANVLTNCTGQGGAQVVYTVEVSNECGEPVSPSCDPPSGSRFQPGITTVLCQAREDRGDPAFCSFTVEVQDEAAPTITCPSDVLVEAQGLDGALVTWSVTATDDCDSNVTVYCEPPSGASFPLGGSRVMCRALDDSGNAEFCGFTVTVTNSGPLRIEQADGAAGPVVRLRWRGNGVPEETPSLDPPVDWEAVTAPIEQNGDERLVEVPLGADNRFYRLQSTPLAPPPDGDGDGVPDSADRCPETPAGLLVNSWGCSWIDLVGAPDRVTGVASHSLQKAMTEVRRVPRFDGVVPTLDRAMANLRDAEAQIREGLIEEGATLYQQGLSALDSGLLALESLIRELEAERSGRLVPGTLDYGDTTDDDALLEGYHVIAGLLRGAVFESRQAGTNFTTLRIAIRGSQTVSGTVARVEDTGRWVQLESGQTYAFADQDYPGGITTGSPVELDVLSLAGGTGIIRDITGPFGEPPPFAVATPIVKCLSLRIAPVQRFPANSNGPFALHSPVAYLNDGILWLEQGMRLGVQGVCPAFTVTTSNSVVFHRMKLDLDYTTVGGQFKSTTLAGDLNASSPPVPLPVDIDPDATAWLTASVLRYECPIFFGVPLCGGPPEAVCVQGYALRVRPRYAYATALYGNTVFNLEDSPISTDFRAVQPGFVFGNHLGTVSDLQFKAEGYRVQNGESSFPAVKTIASGQEFAIHVFDFYDPYAAPFLQLVQVLDLGVTKPSGLMWPRVTGKHNGATFSYSCGLPTVIRDRIAPCGGAADTYYRLPFVGGWPTWTMGQGNNGTFTHMGNSAFAFDMRAPQGTQIRAARGGIVAGLLETTSGNCFNQAQSQCINCGPTPNNFVIIEHQDGTFGRYVHMPQNGVSVTVGQRIYRGDILGVVGNTGCSSTPHLHFEARSSLTGPSIPSTFQAWTVCNVPLLPPFPCVPVAPCYVPQTGDILFSTNRAWWE